MKTPQAICGHAGSSVESAQLAVLQGWSPGH
ncbi:hypothetical protein EPYR_03103 [Erwinia pyrifoliae DSM 12163]|nr:hypothetical protein EPYR_03103 [Erwinia pyrifoliae DSM 12163]